MLKERIIETNDGIQEELAVEIFDQFAKGIRDKGWNNVGSIIKAGIVKGNVLEIGPGPGYVGLEWLKKFPKSKLTGCEISPNMIKLATRNTAEYGLQENVNYVEGNCMDMPFEDESFDGVFSEGSLHEWEDPICAFNEIFRVLKPGGAFCISDMRRDSSKAIKWLMYCITKPKEIRPGFLTSFNAAYTVEELEVLLHKSKLKNFAVEKDFFGLSIIGSK